jgi:hypothetical protein
LEKSATVSSGRFKTIRENWKKTVVFLSESDFVAIE